MTKSHPLPTIGTITCYLCPATESRAGDFGSLESMGWVCLVGQRWTCPRCSGRAKMADSFWDPVKWSEPQGPIVLHRNELQ